jgi:hypothetical protein
MTPISGPYPDVVYPVRRGDYNDELRYSLRSLVNVPHGNVILSGYVPSWATDVVEVPREQDRHWSHWANVRANLAAALPFASDPFYLFNDDFYVMQSIEQIPITHMGPFGEMIERYRRTRHTGAYWKGMVATNLVLQEWGYSNPLSFELHMPLLMHHAPLLEALDKGQGIEALALRTAYGNIAQLEGEQKQDCKVMARAGVLHWDAWPFLSSNDDLPYSPVGKHLARTFPEQSRYEHHSQ